MIIIAEGEWIADLGNILYQYINNGIIVSFERQGKLLTGKIKDIPMESFQQWAMIPNGDKPIEKSVMEVEIVFFEHILKTILRKTVLEKNVTIQAQ